MPASLKLRIDQRGYTALIGAAFKDELRIARWLLAEPCVDPQAANAMDQTADQFATLFGHEALRTLRAQHSAASAQPQ